MLTFEHESTYHWLYKVVSVVSEITNGLVDGNLALVIQLLRQRVDGNQGARSANACRTVNDDWPIRSLGRLLVDPLDEVEHSRCVLRCVEVLPLEVVVMPDRSTCLLLFDAGLAALHCQRQLAYDVVRKSLLRAESDIDDQVRGGHVVQVTGLGPILSALDTVVLLQVGQHDDHFNSLKSKQLKVEIMVNSIANCWVAE